MQRVIELSQQWFVMLILLLIFAAVGVVTFEVFRGDAPTSGLPEELILPTLDPNALPVESSVLPEQIEADVQVEPDIPVPVGDSAEQTHQVATGDTLYGIALQYGTTIDALVAYNQLANPDDLDIGQLLKIPPVP